MAKRGENKTREWQVAGMGIKRGRVLSTAHSSRGEFKKGEAWTSHSLMVNGWLQCRAEDTHSARPPAAWVTGSMIGTTKEGRKLSPGGDLLDDDQMQWGFLGGETPTHHAGSLPRATSENHHPWPKGDQLIS
jgi:hypothetical protein